MAPEIIKKLGLKETDKTLSSSFIKGSTLYEHIDIYPERNDMQNVQ